jgi:hypothetical protein
MSALVLRLLLGRPSCPFLIILFLCVGPATRAADLPFKIDERTAQRLAAEGWGHHIEPKWFDYDPGMGRPFLVFYGLTESDGGFGYFAVNPWTGDVWALWGCHKLSTPALRKLKADIRRRFTREELTQYARLARLKPECIFED